MPFRKIVHQIRGLFEEKIDPISYSELLGGIDVHSHLVSQVDDGSKSMEESLMMISAMVEMGYKKIITTPHIMIDGYPNSSTGLKKNFAKLEAAVKEAGIEVELDIAAEYYVDSHLDALIELDDLLSFTEHKFVLIEYSYLNRPHNFLDIIDKLIKAGYRPILAHPERYMYFHGALQAFDQIRSMGALLQMNMFSLAGAYGPAVRQCAIDMINNEMYDLVGSDLHNPRQLNYVKGLMKDKHLKQLLESGNIKNKELLK